MHEWFPRNISTYGADVDGVFFLVYWIVGVWFVLAQGALLYLIVRFRRRPGQPARYIAGDSWKQLAWVLVPALLVIVLDFGIDTASARVWERIKTYRPAGDVRMQLEAKQFEWLFLYPGPDGEPGNGDDFEINGELRVPVGKDIRITMRSKDVLHSFFLPNVRLKQDVVPGRAIDVWFQVTETGTYEIGCAELCGFGHYNMKGSFVVQTQEEYDAWVAQQSAKAHS